MFGKYGPITIMSNPIRFHYCRIVTAFVLIGVLALLYYAYYTQYGFNNVFTESDLDPKIVENGPSLTYNKRQFFLHGVPFRIIAGEIHYFRVPQQYWHDRLLKLRAAGCNTLTTAAPWNLHEEMKERPNFDGMLDVRKFLQTAHKLGLRVIFKVGPYISSQLDFGGLPAWLLADPNMKVRSLYIGFTSAVDGYFKMLMNEIADLQATRGGPIIAFQLENDYASYGDNAQYLHFLRRTVRRYGGLEAAFTADSAHGVHRRLRLPGSFVGVAAAGRSDSRRLLSIVQSWDQHLPPFVSELSTGPPAAWGDRLPTTKTATTADSLAGVAKELLVDRGASVSFCMFHGGTNFGFVAGRRPLAPPFVTSNDRRAPVDEAGQLTHAYARIRQLLLHSLSLGQLKTLPQLPPPIPTADYGRLVIESIMKWDSIVDLVERPQHYTRPPFMEEIGQNFGFVLYRSTFKSAQTVTVDGWVADRGLVLVNSAAVDSTDPSAGVISSFEQQQRQQQQRQWHISLKNATLKADNNVLDLLVENVGRVSSASFHGDEFNSQRKGVVRGGDSEQVNAEQVQTGGGVLVNGRQLRSFRVASLDFGRSFLAKASVNANAWLKPLAGAAASAPALHRTQLLLSPPHSPADTFVNMAGWGRGLLFVNGFNVGRYCHCGPQTRLFLPATLLRQGVNHILVFELHSAGSAISFSRSPDGN